MLNAAKATAPLQREMLDSFTTCNFTSRQINFTGHKGSRSIQKHFDTMFGCELHGFGSERFSHEFSRWDHKGGTSSLQNRESFPRNLL